MVGQDGYIKIVDMDTAKDIQDKNGHQGRTYTVIGTPHYMAPEVMQGKGYNKNCDLFSLGVVAYELLCGCLPYGDKLNVNSKIYFQDPYDIYREMVQSEQV